MCGIVGYVGQENGTERLLRSLEALEYRGYDSAGIAVFEEGHVRITKRAGRLSNLRERLQAEGVPRTTCGIGHTRWATHGAPSDRNAHPHRAGRVTLVHNGIIENYLPLEQELKTRGYTFHSDTDTEVIAALLDASYTDDPLAALFAVTARLEGSFALAVLFDDRPHAVYAIRRESPLVAAIADGACYLASDVTALLPYTRRYYLPSNNEAAVLTLHGITFYDSEGHAVSPPLQTANWESAAAQKGDFPHFMLKEIYEQPHAVQRTLAHRVKDGLPSLVECGLTPERLAAFRQWHVVACGTAMHAGAVGCRVLHALCDRPATVEVASEFRYHLPPIDKRDLVILLSQSGETADTLAALRAAKTRGAATLAIVNAQGSTIAREADMVLYTHAGPEIAVASTKAYTVQLAVMYLLTFSAALGCGSIDEAECRRLTEALCDLPRLLEQTLLVDALCANTAAVFAQARDALFIGRGVDYALCMEGSLKLKEISYIHSEAYPAGELKHGTISLITEGMPLVAVATVPRLFKKTAANVKEAKARGAYTVAIGVNDALPEADVQIPLPTAEPLLMPFPAVLPLQLLAYHTAVKRGCDVDRPRNLAKSVTVE